MRDKRFVLMTVLMPLFNFYSVPINDFPGYTPYFWSGRGIDLPYYAVGSNINGSVIFLDRGLRRSNVVVNVTSAKLWVVSTAPASAFYIRRLN